jgi:hypothetical protein
MRVSNPLHRLPRPERVRVSLLDAGGGMPLPLPGRRPWIAGLALGLAFVVFASMAVGQIRSVRFRTVDTALDLLLVLLQGLWLAFWWVGVAVLLLGTILLLLYAESARLDPGRLIHVSRFGPFRLIAEYDLAKVRNLRVESTGKDGGRIRFDYGERNRGLGADMPAAEAEARVKMIQAAIDSLGRRPSQPVAAPGPGPTPGNPPRPSR